MSKKLERVLRVLAREGLGVCMIHSGSRMVGKAIGGNWLDREWPKGMKFPESKIFPVPVDSPLFEEYEAAQAAAANYRFVNRVILGELWRRRMREVFGMRDLPLLWDQPHNLMNFEPDGDETVLITRKGACPAHRGLPTIIPGSTGSASLSVCGHGE